MAVKFGTNRGHKVHVIDPATLDNSLVESLCGRRIDEQIGANYVDTTVSSVCGNCKRTKKYSELVA